MDELDEAEEIDDEEDEDAGLPGEEVETSLDEIVAKTVDPIDLEEDDDPVIDLTREERLESLSIRPVPKQADEFVCSSCHLVKKNSQLADRKKMLCLDCV